jgi:D-alanyl-D-alanine carboxypeptidase/D-alanyl-D-alanine-endopeptidase (penicillin-binding protein 4)
MFKPFIFLLALLISSTATAQDKLPQGITSALEKAGLPTSSLSLLVTPMTGGTPVLAHNSDLAVSPASTMKLVTSLIALEELGPTFRWKTQVLSDSLIQRETLRGNLYLRGGGDPNLTWDKLSIMLRNLRQLGLRKIKGDIILDRSYFQPTRLDLGVAQFDETPDAYYNVIPDALLIHSNLTSIQLDSNTSNIATRLLTPLANVKLANHLRFNSRPCQEWATDWLPPTLDITKNRQIEIVLNGGFPRNCKISTHVNILDRNTYIASMIRALWTELDGSWQGSVRDGITPAGATLLTERQSETLADTIRIVNKQSDNGMARFLYLTLGAESTNARNYPDHLQAADARVHAWFSRQGIRDDGLVMENGSGLSRLERISAQQLAALLQAAARSNWFAEFASSMPIVAVDGTMRKRLKGTAAEGRSRIKTGTLNNALAVAGYVRDINDVNWIVVGIINSDEARKGKAVLDELIAWVAAGRP